MRCRSNSNDALSVRTKPSPAPSWLPEDLVGHPRYHVLELLGTGGMGSVYRAEHRLMERQVALKVIRKRLVKDDSSVKRFQREVKAAARLSHPNIVTVHDAD
jgi:eukaryotic-like serine/threonine-protein kinase